MRNKVQISIEFSFCIAVSVFLLVLPLRLIIAFLMSITVHELGHFLALMLAKVNVYSIRLRGFGVEMHTEDMTLRKELFCSLAGPASGMLLLPVARYMPCTAVFAFVQSIFNLIPIYPLDGGRALGSVLRKLLGEERGVRACEIISNICIAAIFTGTVYLTVQYRMYIVLFFIITSTIIKLLGRKIPCKQIKQIVQ